MEIRAQLLGAKTIIQKIQVRDKKFPKHLIVSVGYEADYALSVHENVAMRGKGLPRSGEAKFAGYDKQGRRMVTTHRTNSDKKGFYWDPQGQAQAKFLEEPARTERKTIALIIRRSIEAGLTMEQALLQGGFYLQGESQMKVPVDLGILKASAFTRVTQRV